MTIEYKGAVVYTPRTIRETGPKGKKSWDGSSSPLREKRVLELIPDSDPLKDKVIYTVTAWGGTDERIIVGSEINQSPECRTRKIKWYDQNYPKISNPNASSL